MVEKSTTACFAGSQLWQVEILDILYTTTKPMSPSPSRIEKGPEVENGNCEN